MLKKALTLTTLTALATLGISQANAGTTKYGVTVPYCGFDYDKENFCTNDRMKTYSKVMKSRKANFDGNKILYIFKSKGADIIRDKSVKLFRVVVIDKSKKTVIPLTHALGQARDDITRKPIKINRKGDTSKYEFSKSSNKLCFTGNIYAYRDIYSYDPETKEPFCFTYDSEEKSFHRDYD